MGERTAWIASDGAPPVGRALAWALRRGLDEINIVVDDPAQAAVAARVAAHFRGAPRVWAIQGRSLVVARPAPLPVPASPPAAALDLVGVLAASGVEIVIEDGEVRGEVLGLEVARIVSPVGEPARIEVGVGRHDREAFAMVHGDLPTSAALASVVSSVREHRRIDGPPHPLRSLAAERWLRAEVLADPSLVGARSLDAAEGTRRRQSVKDPAPAFAVGEDAAGARVVVAFSAGIDLDLVPAAADARSLHSPEARLLLALPARDAHPVTRELASGLVEPAEVVVVGH